MEAAAEDQKPAPPYALAVIGVLFASICFGSVPYFSRGLTEQGLAPFAVAFYRFVLAAVLMFPSLLGQKAAWREILWGLAAGAVMGLGWIGYVSALETVPASTVGVLYMTYPVFTLLMAWMLFGEPPTRRGLVAAGLIIVAAVIAGSPASIPTEHIPTLVIALAAPFGFGFGICVLVHHLSRITPLARIASVSLGSVLGLSPLMLTSNVANVIPRDSDAWFLIAGIGLATALIPQLIYSVCSPLIGATRTAVVGSIELPTMFAIGLLAFGEAISLAQGIACALVLGAILLTQSRTTRTVTTVMAREPRR